MTAAVTLEVAETLRSDIGFARARLAEKDREKVGLIVGDVISIKGDDCQHITATVWFGRPEDEERGLVRIDHLKRFSAGLDIGTEVCITRVNALPARKITLEPVLDEGHGISIKPGVSKRIHSSIYKQSITAGELIAVPSLTGKGKALHFDVKSVSPDGIVRIADSTVIEIEQYTDAFAPVSETAAPDGFSFQVFECSTGYFWKLLEDSRTIAKSVIHFGSRSSCEEDINRIRAKVRSDVAG